MHQPPSTRGIPISEVLKQHSQTIAGGIDEIAFEKLTVAEMRQQWTEAKSQSAERLFTMRCSAQTSRVGEASLAL
jgi:hypothetical protein